MDSVRTGKAIGSDWAHFRRNNENISIESQNIFHEFSLFILNTGNKNNRISSQLDSVFAVQFVDIGSFRAGTFTDFQMNIFANLFAPATDNDCHMKIEMSQLHVSLSKIHIPW